MGEITRLALVEKEPAFAYNLTTPGCRGDQGCQSCSPNKNRPQSLDDRGLKNSPGRGEEILEFDIHKRRH